MSNRGQVHNFLYGRLAEHCCSRLTACINIGMIAEDVQCMSSYAAGCYVENTGKLLAGDLVDVGDHQKKALGSGIGRGQSTCCQRSVYSACCAGLGLHLSDLNGLSEQVLSSGCSPFISVLRHRG